MKFYYLGCVLTGAAIAAAGFSIPQMLVLDFISAVSFTAFYYVDGGMGG